MKVLKRIPDMDDNALSRLFFNAQVQLQDDKLHEAAASVLEAIEREWQKRLAAYEAGNHKAATPTEGVLSKVGYKVGVDGLKEPVRRRILDYVLTGTLPPVGSPAHMAEWGEPKSRQRFRKLLRVIRVLASSGNTLGTMDKAVAEWEDDLNYLDREWKSKCIS